MEKLTYKIVACVLFSFLGVLMCVSSINAQDTKFRDQAWRVGITGGYQYNNIALGWQSLHQNLQTGLWDDNFHSTQSGIDRVDGSGWGLYGGILGQYLSPSWWGFELRICYDERGGIVLDKTQNPIPEFDIKMSYLTFAPSFLVTPKFLPNLNFHAGFFINANLNGNYKYKPDKDQAYQEPSVDISNLNIATYGIQGGIGYDIKVADFSPTTSLILSPFFDVSWLVNQRKSTGQPNQNSTTDIWSTVSYRGGIKLMLEFRNPTVADRVEYRETIIREQTPAKSKNKVSVMMPGDNTIITRNVTGYFPIHPYVFFEKGSEEIPTRYVVLSKAEAKNFRESDLTNFMKGDLTTQETNIDQLMSTYYNVLNIYGNRMRLYPKENVILRGTTLDEYKAEVSANKVKDYLVNNFGIDPSRISIVTEPPYMPSGSEFSEEESKVMLADENRRVKFIFYNTEMTKPLVYTIRDESSIENDMLFYIDRDVEFRSWDITINGEGRSMYFGPYSYNSARINPAKLMRNLQAGNYTATVEITDKKGKKSSESVNFKLTKDTELKNASRFLMIFDYNASNPVLSYENTVKNYIVPEVVNGDRVIVHGHTDIIGSDEGNQKLSQERSETGKTIIDKELQREKKNVTVQAIGVGETPNPYTFNNRYPEGRMYNRNVFIEVIK